MNEKNYLMISRAEMRARDRAQACLRPSMHPPAWLSKSHIPNCVIHLCPATHAPLHVVAVAFLFAHAHSIHGRKWTPFYIWSFPKKIFYLLHSTSVSRIDCTNAFYATRRTKLDPTCICFNDVFHYSNLCDHLLSFCSNLSVCYINIVTTYVYINYYFVLTHMYQCMINSICGNLYLICGETRVW